MNIDRSKLLPVAGFLLVSIRLAHSSETPALIERPNTNRGPTQISVEIWVVDIHNIDSAQQNFTADVAVVLRWKDPRLAHTGSGVAHYALDQIWSRRVVIVNETNFVTRRLPESVEVDPDGTVLYRQRYVGSFTQSLHLQSFPLALRSRESAHVVRKKTGSKVCPGRARSSPAEITLGPRLRALPDISQQPPLD